MNIGGWIRHQIVGIRGALLSLYERLVEFSRMFWSRIGSIRSYLTKPNFIDPGVLSRRGRYRKKFRSYWRAYQKNQDVEHARQQQFLSTSIALQELDPPRALSRSIVVISSFILVAIIWMAVTKIEEKTTAIGQIQPSGSLYTVQHLEGGIIQGILVEEGSRVEAGEVLVRMSPIVTLSDLQQMRIRQMSLMAKCERLKAFAFERQPDFPVQGLVRFPQLVSDQVEVLKFQNEARDKQKEVWLARIDQRKSEVDTLNEQKANLEKQIDLVGEEVDIQAYLMEKGLMSKLVYLQTLRQQSELQGQLQEVKTTVNQAQSAIVEAEMAMSELEARLKNEALDEMGTIESELAQVNEAILSLEDRADRLEVRSVVSGIVQGLRFNSIGAVVGPGEKLMDIIPTGEQLVAETRVAPKNIGYVKPGQRAEVKITAYDFTRYGKISGKVRSVSATTFSDTDGSIYYKVVVGLDKNYVGANPKVNLLQPGMVVEADIVSGRKSILEYLLKPIYRSMEQAFTEQ